jgi:hypothetical protein
MMISPFGEPMHSISSLAFPLAAPFCWHQDLQPWQACCEFLRTLLESSTLQLGYLEPQAHLYDETPEWIQWAAHTGLRHTLEQRKRLFTQLLALIRECPVPLVFLGSYPVYGTTREIAHACLHHMPACETLSQEARKTLLGQWYQLQEAGPLSTHIRNGYLQKIRLFEEALKASTTQSFTESSTSVVPELAFFQPQSQQRRIRQSLRYLVQQEAPSPIDGKNQGKHLRIRLTLQGPPLAVLESLLTHGWHLAFFYPEGKTLAALLDQLYLKLSERMGLLRLDPLWESQVSWFIGMEPSPLDYVEWRHDETLFIQEKGTTFSLLRWSGNHYTAPWGWSESFPSDGTPLPTRLQDLAPHKFPAKTWAPIFACPWAIWIRSLFFQEVFFRQRLGRYEACLQALEQAHWTFASHLERWEAFFHHRNTGYTLSREQVQSFPLLWESWSITSWKQLKTPPSTPDNPLPPTATSFCALLLAGLCSYILLWADWIVVESLGIPETLGAPSQEFKNTLRHRTYFTHHWPEWHHTLATQG